MITAPEAGVDCQSLHFIDYNYFISKKSKYNMLCDTLMYRDAIAETIYIRYKRKWVDINTLDFDSLPNLHKQAISHSLLTTTL